MANGHSAVVEQVTHIHKFEGSNLAVPGAGRNNQK